MQKMYSTIWKNESDALAFAKHNENDQIASSKDVENCSLDVGTIWDALKAGDRLLLSDGQFQVSCPGSIWELIMEHEEVLETALKWAEQFHKEASRAKQCALANSVSYLVSGASGGYGGPSVREQAVSHALAGKHGQNIGMLQFPDGTLPRPGNWAIAVATIFAEPIVFGDLTSIHEECWQSEYCFDDDPEDEKILRGRFG